MRTIITGNCSERLVEEAVRASGFRVTSVLCRGDERAEAWGRHRVPVIQFSGTASYQRMIAEADALIALWDGKGKDDEVLVQAARTAGLKVWLHLVSPRSEAAILRDIELALGAEPDLLLLRNSVGATQYTNARTGKSHAVKFGLGEGSPDLVGILRQGSRGLWFCLEVKREGEEAEPHQAKCHEQWRRFGAFVAVVHSKVEALAALRSARSLGVS